MNEAREAKTQSQVWRVINKERRRKAEINNRIEMGEWDEYFREILGGTERQGERKEEERNEWRESGGEPEDREEEELSQEEIQRVIGKLRKGKATGEDGIQNEVWMWGGKGIKEALGRICQGI